MNRDDTVRLVATLDDGTTIVEHADGRLERRRSESDWARVDALSDEAIDASTRGDPDWADFQELDWSKAVPLDLPRKKPISIRVDEDVLAFFKAQGAGYQRRMNAVLRTYVSEMRRTGAKGSKQAG